MNDLEDTQLIRLSTGVSLETNISAPPNTNPTDGNKLAVCLHPWSWLGGRMNDPVLDSLAEPLHDRGYHVLRFNSRGVGKSSGWPSFTGLSEAKDLEALVQWGLQTVSNVQSLVIVGYSYGSLIASLHPILPPPIQTSHILLSYPIGKRGFLTLFNSSTYSSALRQVLQDTTSTVLVIFGDSDEFTSGSEYDSWAEELQKEAKNAGRLEVVKVEGGSHFWRGADEKQMIETVERWLP